MCSDRGYGGAVYGSSRDIAIARVGFIDARCLMAAFAVRHCTYQGLGREPPAAAAPITAAAAAGILDDKGDLADGPDTLENALVVEERARRKARDAAVKKAKPLWEEDGKVSQRWPDACSSWL